MFALFLMLFWQVPVFGYSGGQEAKGSRSDQCDSSGTVTVMMGKYTAGETILKNKINK